MNTNQWVFNEDMKNLPENEKKRIIDGISQLDTLDKSFFWHGIEIKINPAIIMAAEKYNLNFQSLLDNTLNNASPAGNIKEAYQNLAKRYSTYKKEDEESINKLDTNELKQYFSNITCAAMQTIIYKACMEKETERDNERE